jgi:ribosomal protein L24
VECPVSAKHATPITTRVVEYRGSEIEVSGVRGDVLVTIDGVDIVRTKNGAVTPFPSAEHAIEYAKVRLDSRAKRETPVERRVLVLDVSWWETDGYARKWAEAYS